MGRMTRSTQHPRVGEGIAAAPQRVCAAVRWRHGLSRGPDALRQTKLVMTEAVHPVASPTSWVPRDEARRALMERVLGAPVVPARANRRYAAGDIAEAFLRGRGPSAEKLLSSDLDRAAAGLILLVTDEQRTVTAKPSHGDVVQLTTLAKPRIGRPETATDRSGDFRGKKRVGFAGYRKLLYPQTGSIPRRSPMSPAS